MAAEEKPIERGPKGGRKHRPGRGHDRRSSREKKKRFARKAAKKHRQQDEEAREEWAEWDALPDEVKQLLGPAAEPEMPRPKHEH